MTPAVSVGRAGSLFTALFRRTPFQTVRGILLEDSWGLTIQLIQEGTHGTIRSRTKVDFGSSPIAVLKLVVILQANDEMIVTLGKWGSQSFCYV